MKFTKSDIKRIILEDIETNEALLDAIDSLSSKIEDLDISIDYLSAAVTGEDPISIGSAQRALGRGAVPHMRVKPSAKELEEAIREELETILSEEEYR